MIVGEKESAICNILLLDCYICILEDILKLCKSEMQLSENMTKNDEFFHVYVTHISDHI